MPTTLAPVQRQKGQATLRGTRKLRRRVPARLLTPRKLRRRAKKKGSNLKKAKKKSTLHFT
jgi:hypothetical protein